ncbi:MAG: hypothetical protein JW744_03235, partial [Candidatus Diapherotrites archaeon]|nr:hypothetical protein [Candidatus Diapherotrites archaeon]
LKVQNKTMKQVFFLLLIFLIMAVVFVLISNMGTVLANALWVFLIALFVLVIWKFDFLVLLKDYERAVIMRFGKVNRVGGPGWCIMIPGIEDKTVVDLRTQTVDVPKQDVITSGNIELRVDAVIYLRVRKDRQSVVNSVIEVEDYKDAIKLYIISTLRDIIGSMPLSGVIANTEVIETRLQKEAEKISQDWGVEVVSVDLKDVDIPKTVLDAMHEEKAAEQQKLARMESAKAHMAEIEAVKQAAEQLSDRALAYYYVRALEKIGEGKSTKFIFPMELTKLADAVTGSISRKPGPELERMFEKYAPAITNVLSPKEKETIKKKAKKRK